MPETAAGHPGGRRLDWTCPKYSNAVRAGRSAMRYVPLAAVRVRATSRPDREKTITAPAAGALHGSSAMHTGVIGPRVTLPYSPLLTVEP